MLTADSSVKLILGGASVQQTAFAITGPATVSIDCFQRNYWLSDSDEWSCYHINRSMPSSLRGQTMSARLLLLFVLLGAFSVGCEGITPGLPTSDPAQAVYEAYIRFEVKQTLAAEPGKAPTFYATIDGDDP